MQYIITHEELEALKNTYRQDFENQDALVRSMGNTLLRVSDMIEAFHGAEIIRCPHHDETWKVCDNKCKKLRIKELCSKEQKWNV